MNNGLQYNLQAEPEQYKSEVDEIYLPKPGNWPFISENNGAMYR